MSGSDPDRGGPFPPPSPPRLPPPEHGIRARRFGTTWWARRWIGALERFGAAYSLRLGRGRGYARQGRVHDLTVEGGAVRARVTGTRPEPYQVTIRLTPLPDPVWDRVIQMMASKALFAAQLLSGEMPRQVDEVFRRAGASLFPETERDLQTACTCPDWANPCKHVAAVHYVLGEFLDRDPFLLFELRGRARATVLAQLHKLRASRAGRRRQAAEPPTPTAAPGPPPPYDAFRAPVGDLRFHIEPAAVPGAILRQLGTPPSWQFPLPPREVLGPLVARAAALARDLALGGAAEERD